MDTVLHFLNAAGYWVAIVLIWFEKEDHGSLAFEMTDVPLR